MNKICFALVSLLFLISSCGNESKINKPMHQHADGHTHARTDHHSYSQPELAISKHLKLNLEADFSNKILSGTVSHVIENKGAEEIIFDCKNLNIKSVRINTQTSDVEYTIKGDDKFLGQALHVPIDKNTTEVTIEYATKAEAVAVQWLSPVQTTDKKEPFLFTQGQAILTRSWIPCQDSPGIRISYEATLKVPSNLMAVMSAENPQEKTKDGVYHFKMNQPIPPYLIALAIGDLEFKKIGARTGVYAEPSMIDKAYYEFGDMEKMLLAAEELYGPYLWEQYDVIVLPASFPFGGMENPRLTFATPTILAGDRSLTALIAHELAHSWSGNLVTNATWDDFWLNEGFTVYFERRIMESLYGVEYVNMLTQLGLQDLDFEISDLGKTSKDTHLKLSLKDRDPDDGMTDIAYEKGALFLMALEAQVGRETFDSFLKKYFGDHKFQTLTTEEFIVYLNKNLIEPENVKIDLDAWIYQPGLPADRPNVSSNKFSLVESYLEEQLKSTSWKKEGTKDWTTHEWLHFIRSMPKDMKVETAQEIEKIFKFSNSGNSEILAAWLENSINNGHIENIESSLEGFLVKVGRRKFLTPLYRALKDTGRIDLAREIYTKARPNYHAVSTQTMDDLLLP